MKIVLLFIILFYSSLIASSDDKGIKHALLKYNYGIIKMGKSGETQFFKDFVKEDVAIKLQVWFESWKFSNLTYIAEINDLRFSPIAYNEDNATIRTLENWTFSYVNLATREIALEPTQIFYKMHYTLKRNGDEWMIVDVKHLQEKVITQNKNHNPALRPEKDKEEIAVEQNLSSG